MDPLQLIEKVASKIAPGRSPSFTMANVIRALAMIDRREIGRITLSKELGLGEGVTRTLLKHLRREGVVRVSRRGIALSNFGKEIASHLRSKISAGIEVQSSPVTVAHHNIAVLVAGVTHLIDKGIEQRDSAIKAGALGATTFVFSNNRLVMPTSKEDVFKDIPLVHEVLLSNLNPREDDVVIIGSGETKMSAEIGAIAAALDLLKSVLEDQSAS
jgi:predicted transcriptional regulator